MVKEGVFGKILVPVDDSVASLAAQELAASIAKSFKSNVTVLSVVSHKLMTPSFQSIVGETGVQEFAPSQIGRGEYSMPRRASPSGSGGGLSPKMLAEINDWYHQRGNEVADEAVRLFKEKDISAKWKVVEHSDRADSVLREAKSGNHSLIVMGHGG